MSPCEYCNRPGNDFSTPSGHRVHRGCWENFEAGQRAYVESLHERDAGRHPRKTPCVWLEDIRKQASYLRVGGRFPYLCNAHDWTIYA